jgi:hypothetical protein
LISLSLSYGVSVREREKERERERERQKERGEKQRQRQRQKESKRKKADDLVDLTLHKTSSTLFSGRVVSDAGHASSSHLPSSAHPPGTYYYISIYVSSHYTVGYI